jgi:hypothetical protein
MVEDLFKQEGDVTFYPEEVEEKDFQMPLSTVHSFEVMFNIDNQEYFEPFEKAAPKPFKMIFGILKLAIPPTFASHYEPHEGEVEFEECAYVINFEEGTFDYYNGSEVTKSFKFENLPSKTTDFKEDSSSDGNGKEPDDGADSEDEEKGESGEEEQELVGESAKQSESDTKKPQKNDD